MFAAAAMLFATSCVKEEPVVIPTGDEAQVTFALNRANGVATRAISDGLSADKLVYAIYDADDKLITTIANSNNGELVKENAFPNGLTDQVSVTLAKGQTYTAVFWAQDADCTAYTVTTEEDGIKVAVNYQGDNNDESRDAFFKAETFTVEGDAEINVVLNRPFAQINLGVFQEDWDAAVASGVEIAQSMVTIQNAATDINLLTGEATGAAAVTYDSATIPAKMQPAEILSVDLNKDGAFSADEQFVYLSMSYILVGENKTTLETNGLQFTFQPVAGEEIVFDEGLDAVPVQRNWRTNILGKILTGDIDFNITIDKDYYGDNNNKDGEESTNEIAPGVTVDGNIYHISSAEGLKWVSDQTNKEGNSFNGYTVMLVADIDLNGIDFAPIGGMTKKAFTGTFDGGNHVIRNLSVNVTDDSSPAGLFATARIVKNVKLENVNVAGHFKTGALVGDGVCARIENCHVNGGSVTATTNSQNDNANNVGGLVGYLSSEFGTSPTYSYVTDCSVKNLTVKAYRDVAGLVGTVTASGKPVISGNTVSNVTVIADQLTDYVESKPANAGEIVGRNLNTSLDLTANTSSNVTVKVLAIENGVATVSDDASLVYALKNGATNIALMDGNYDIHNLAVKNTDINIVGESRENTIIKMEQTGIYPEGSKVKFSNLTISVGQLAYGAEQTYGAMYRTAALDIENCDIIGCICLCGYGETNIVGCDFYNTTTSGFNGYGLFYYGYDGSVVNVKDCNFDMESKAIVLYNHSTAANTVKFTLNVDNCKFSAKTTSDKAAIQMHTEQGSIYGTVNITNSTATGFIAKNNGLWNEVNNSNQSETDKFDIFVDGIQVH